MRFAAAPEYQVFPTRDKPLKPYVAAVKASASTRELIRCSTRTWWWPTSSRPARWPRRRRAALGDARAARDAHGRAGFPVYSVGAVYPRTAVGRRVWELVRPLVMTGEEQGRVELNGARAGGLPPLGDVHGGISASSRSWRPSPSSSTRERRLAWDARDRAAPVEQPFGDVELLPGERPLVLVAPSTSQDPEHRLVRAALEGLAGEPVRVLATTNRREPPEPARAFERVVDWVSYAHDAACDAVVCHAGHGTLVRALASGVPVVACPHAGDMAENAARIRWAGAGVSLPRRFTTPRGVRRRRRLLAEPSYGGAPRSWATGRPATTGQRRPEAVEELAE